MEEKKNERLLLVDGSRLVIESAVRAGADVFVGYPITPANLLYLYSSRRFPMMFPALDEITTLQWMSGLSAAGKYPVTATSYPGFALMLESLASQGSSDLITEIEVIRSFPVVERVAKELNVVKTDVTPEEARCSAYLGAIYGLQQTIKTSIEGASNIIRISVTANTADMAQRFARIGAPSKVYYYNSTV